jgi:hypothetical protein
LKKWGLSLEDAKGFALEMDRRIRDLPLPDKGKIRSRVVYSQSIDGDGVVHSVLFWCDTDQRYLDRLDEYAKRAGIRVKIERDRIPGQTYVKAEVEMKRKQEAAVNHGVPEKPNIDWPRPTTFQAKHGDWQILWVMKRAKTVSTER